MSVFAGLFLLALSATELLAQAPDSVWFQGMLTDPGGTPLNTTASMTFKLYKNGTAVWTETQPSVVVTDGIFNVLLGGITPLDAVAFNQPIEIGIKVGTDPEISPRTALAAAPYALGMRGMYALWAEDGTNESFNVVGGAPNNVVAADVAGATIGGGGGTVDATSSPNIVSGDFGTVSGGLKNQAGYRATVGGGAFNTANGSNATVGGGIDNVAGAFGATVGGGDLNGAIADYATVGGGHMNTANLGAATVGGGQQNTAGGTRATVGGGIDNTAGGSRSTVGGGQQNTAGAQYATVGGGNLNTAGGTASSVPGGSNNAARGDYSFAAGYNARPQHEGSFAWADRSSTSLADSLETTGPNQFLIRAAGGVGIGTNAPAARLTIEGPDNSSTGPMISFFGTVSDQTESGRLRFIEGGHSNFRGGFIHYDGGANRLHLGVHNTNSTDAANDDRVITIPRSSGRVGIQNESPAHPLHVGTDTTNGNGAHATVGGVWTNGSSRSFKDGFEEIDKIDILERLAALEVTKWTYKGYDRSAHIGPTAEDFREAFGLGHDERYITTVDADGVALAAIQGLYALVKDQQAVIESQSVRLAEMEARMEP